jgi:hypothetical protein
MNVKRAVNCIMASSLEMATRCCYSSCNGGSRSSHAMYKPCNSCRSPYICASACKCYHSRLQPWHWFHDFATLNFRCTITCDCHLCNGIFIMLLASATLRHLQEPQGQLQLQACKAAVMYKLQCLAEKVCSLTHNHTISMCMHSMHTRQLSCTCEILSNSV